MTLIGIGLFWLYQSIFFYFSLSPKLNQADETLRRIYNHNFKTLSINSAGKHHRGFYPSRCSRNCSILSSNTLDTHILIYQSINLCGFFFLHFKLLQLLNSGRPIFVGSQTRRTMLSAVLGSMPVLLSNFRHLCCKMLAHFASISTWQSLQLLFHWHLSSLKASTG